MRRTGVAAHHVAALVLAVLTRSIRAADSALSGGPDGRGWGGAVVAECGLGVTTEHPTKAGFRVTMRAWAKAATVQWQFDGPVELLKHWGPVRPLPQEADGQATLAFRLKGEKLPSMRRNRTQHAHRTDQWGFVLAEPYTGRWRQSCALAPSPPSAAARSRGTQPSIDGQNGASSASMPLTDMAPPPPPTPPGAVTEGLPPAASGIGSWIASVGLSKLSAAAAAVGLVSSAGAMDRATARASSAEDGEAGRSRRGGGRGRRARARRRRQRQKQQKHG